MMGTHCGTDSMARGSPGTVLSMVVTYKYLAQQVMNGGVTNTPKPWHSAMLEQIPTSTQALLYPLGTTMSTWHSEDRPRRYVGSLPGST